MKHRTIQLRLCDMQCNKHRNTLEGPGTASALPPKSTTTRKIIAREYDWPIFGVNIQSAIVWVARVHHLHGDGVVNEASAMYQKVNSDLKGEKKNIRDYGVLMPVLMPSIHLLVCTRKYAYASSNSISLPSIVPSTVSSIRSFEPRSLSQKEASTINSM